MNTFCEDEMMTMARQKQRSDHEGDPADSDAATIVNTYLRKIQHLAADRIFEDLGPPTGFAV